MYNIDLAGNEGFQKLRPASQQHRLFRSCPFSLEIALAVGDQKRIMTPSRAIASGADYLVVGRPVVDAVDPKAAAEAIVSEIARARA